MQLDVYRPCADARRNATIGTETSSDRAKWLSCFSAITHASDRDNRRRDGTSRYNAFDVAALLTASWPGCPEQTERALRLQYV